MFSQAEADPILAKEPFKLLQARLRPALLKAQYARLQKAEHALLIVIAGIDGVGKGSTVNLLNEWMDPRHIRTLTFGPPTAQELEYPPMWRYWKQLPAKGSTGIVFGSWYMPLLHAAARKKRNAESLATQYTAVNHFESMLLAEGVQIVKLWFHLSASAQAERSKRLLASPETAWQVTPEDLRVPQQYCTIRAASLHVLSHTNSSHAPWTVIPSADHNLRTVCGVEAILQAMRRRPQKSITPRATLPAQNTQRIPNQLGTLNYQAKSDKDTYESELGLLQGRLARTMRAKKFSDHALVLVFEGQDAAGKGGVIRRLTHALDARQFNITQVAAPDSYALAYPYLWRFWRRVPGRGRIAIFDRSWYGRVLVERVEALTPAAHWRRAYTEINDFEAQLSQHGVLVLKFWLAITAEVQLKRFHEREQSPFKRFKITPEDWRNREKWQAYYTAANEMFARTHQPHAPWHIVPANDKRYARLEVLRQIVQAVEAIA
jgi:polyphosphate:AMP phosphotransferase